MNYSERQRNMASQNSVDDNERGTDEILSRDTIRCMILEREETNPKLAGLCFPHGMVIDDACAKKWLEQSVQETRKSLPLNHKRPTVDRRFYCDTTREVICKPLEAIVRHALSKASDTDPENESTDFVVYCNKYLRFLEYKTVGGELLPHRDGTKTCEDTGKKSTHTLLLFLSECEFGGETLIMDDASELGKNNWSTEKNLLLDTYETLDGEETTNSDRILNKRRIRYIAHKRKSEIKNSIEIGCKTKIFCLRDASIRGIDDNREGEEVGAGLLPPPRHVSVGIQPWEGRIFLFPHHWPHAGAMCKSVPKIALRAEVTIARA